MKKIVMICQLIIATCYGSLLYATEPTASSAAHVRHSIINNYMPAHGVDYELNDSNGVTYRGFLNPGQIKIINFNDTSEKLYGAYSLSSRICNVTWTGVVCKSFNKLLIIKKNEDVIWEVTSKGIKVTEFPD